MRKTKFNKNFSSNFYSTLNTRVKSYFKSNQLSPYGNTGLFLKIILFYIIYFFLYTCLVFDLIQKQYIMFVVILFGLTSALIGLNVSHDAVHKALFRSSLLNRIFSYSFDMIGMSSYIWKLKHNIIHHNFPNLQKCDFDIEAAPIIRMSPADRLKPFHRYQHIYAPFIYLFFSITLVFISDIKIMFFTNRGSIDGKQHPSSQILIFIFGKIAYLFFILGLPLLLLPYTVFEILGAFLLMHFLLSFVLAFVLLPAHVFEATVFPKINADETIQEDWAIYQMKTTLDYSRKSRFLNSIFGGFNLNVTHHLFPRICHIHLIPIANIVKKTAKEYDVDYNETSFWYAIISHFRMLKLLGKQVNLR